jgi:hypothetical protein
VAYLSYLPLSFHIYLISLSYQHLSLPADILTTLQSWRKVDGLYINIELTCCIQKKNGLLHVVCVVVISAQSQNLETYNMVAIEDKDAPGTLQLIDANGELHVKHSEAAHDIVLIPLPSGTVITHHLDTSSRGTKILTSSR